MAEAEFLADLKARFPDLAGRVRTNESLSEHVTLKVGGPAQYFCEAREGADLKALLGVAREHGLPVFILGQGSNIYFSDAGFKGLVVKNLCQGFEFSDEGFLETEAGVLLGQLVKMAMDRNLSGLGVFAGLPGTIGGAVYGNSGRMGHEIGELVEKVLVFDLVAGEEKFLTREEIGFGYRSSGLKEALDKPVILKVWLKLNAEEPEVLRKRQAEIMEQLAEREYPPEPNAGSFFKNPGTGQAIAQAEADQPGRQAVGREKLTAGQLIEQAGLKGYQVGGAKISEKHANYLVNMGGATAKDIQAVAVAVKEKVKEKFGVELEEEVRMVG